jgi:hypothetical protein
MGDTAVDPEKLDDSAEKLDDSAHTSEHQSANEGAPPQTDGIPQDGEWKKAMSRIQDFFSTENAMEQLDWALHSPRGSQRRSASPLSGGDRGYAPTADEAWQKAMQKASLHVNNLNASGTSKEIPHEFSPDQPSISGDPDGPPGAEDSGFNWQFRIGLPRTLPVGEDEGGVTEGDMRYLQIPEGGRGRFHQFAKQLAAQLSIECADANPYIQALCAHRAELLKSSVSLADEVVDSLPSRLATQHEGLATLRHEIDLPETPSCGILGPSSVIPGCRDQFMHSETPRDLLVNPIIHYVGTTRIEHDTLDIPVPYNAHGDLAGASSANASTAASTVSLGSDAPQRSGRLSLRTDSGKLKLGEEDKEGFLAMLNLNFDGDEEAPPPPPESEPQTRTVMM